MGNTDRKCSPQKNPLAKPGKTGRWIVEALNHISTYVPGSMARLLRRLCTRGLFYLNWRQVDRTLPTYGSRDDRKFDAHTGVVVAFDIAHRYMVTRGQNDL